MKHLRELARHGPALKSILCFVIAVRTGPLEKSPVGVHQTHCPKMPQKSPSSDFCRPFASGQGPHGRVHLVPGGLGFPSPFRSSHCSHSSHCGRTIFTKHRRHCNFRKIRRHKPGRFCGEKSVSGCIDVVDYVVDKCGYFGWKGFVWISA